MTNKTKARDEIIDRAYQAERNAALIASENVKLQSIITNQEKELSDLREFADKAKEVIAFYGDKESWQTPRNQFTLAEHEDDYDLADMIDDDTELSDEKRGGFGGKRARELQSSDIWKRVFK